MARVSHIEFHQVEIFEGIIYPCLKPCFIVVVHVVVVVNYCFTSLFGTNGYLSDIEI